MHTGTASGFVNIFIGGHSVLGQLCLLQPLNALALYLSLVYFSNASLLLAVAGIGSVSGGSVNCLLGQKQGRGLSGSHSPSGCHTGSFGASDSPPSTPEVEPARDKIFSEASPADRFVT